MAISDDLVKKITALQRQVDSTILPEYEAAKKAVDDISAELKKLESLGKMTAAQGQSYAAIKGGAGTPGTLALAVEDLKNRESPAQVQQKTQASLQGLMDHLAAQAPHMKAATAAQYDSLKAAAFTGSDPQAQEDFKRFVGNLQTVPSKDIHKDLRKWVSEQLKTGVKVSMDDFAQKRKTLQEGETVMPGENPQLKQEYERATATGVGRLRANFKGHLSSGGAEALGFAALNLGHEGGEYLSQPLTGDRYTAEARYRSGLGLIPGAAGLVGGVVGAFTPAGPFAGAAIAGGVASAVVAPLSALSEKHEDLRLAGEGFSQVMGLGTKAAGQFADAIEKTAGRMGTPAAELAQSLRSLSSSVVGFNPVKAAGLQATLQRGAGDLYPELVAAQAKAAQQIPMSDSFQDMIAGNRPPDKKSYADAANYYALHGDLDTAHKLLIANGQFDYTPAMQKAQAWKGEMENEGGFSGWMHHIAEKIPHTAAWNQRRENDADIKKLVDTGQDKVASGSAKDLTDSLARGLRDAMEATEPAGYDAARAGVGVSLAQATGRGAAGMRPFVEQQVSSLTERGTQLQAAEAQYVKAVDAASPDDKGMYRADLAHVRLELAQNNAQLKEAQVGLWRQGQSEHQAAFEGGLSRTQTQGQALTLGGLNSYDPAVAANLAAQQARLAAQAKYDLSLANDKSNFLSPEEREQRRTAAAREALEIKEIKNRQAVDRIQDAVQGSGARQAGLRVGVARGEVSGDIASTLTAQNALVGEQLRLHGELNTRLAAGNLTYQQRMQLTSQIKDLEAQTVVAQRQALDTAITGFQGRAEARSSSAYSREERGVRLRGTGDETRAEAGRGYDEALSGVALAKYRRDTALSPDQRALYDADYQRAKNSAEQQGIEAFSRVEMAPDFDTKRIRAEARLSRQERSPFEPGSVLQSNAALAKMDGEKLKQIDAQMRAVMARQDLTGEQKSVIRRNLTGQQEETRNDIFERQQSVDVGWVDRLTAMSVSAPSFASRLMPPADRVASIAEKRGLGQMSARVFGYTDRQSYRDAETMGVLPSEVGKMAFGMRAGDFPSADGPDAPVVGGTGQTIDSIDKGGVGAGVMPEVLGGLNTTLAALVSLMGKGFTVNVVQMNESTGQSAAHTQNTQGVNGAAQVMRGGAAHPPGAPAVGWYG